MKSNHPIMAFPPNWTPNQIFCIRLSPHEKKVLLLNSPTFNPRVITSAYLTTFNLRSRLRNILNHVWLKILWNWILHGAQFARKHTCVPVNSQQYQGSKYFFNDPKLKFWEICTFDCCLVYNLYGLNIIIHLHGAKKFIYITTEWIDRRTVDLCASRFNWGLHMEMVLL